LRHYSTKLGKAHKAIHDAKGEILTLVSNTLTREEEE
jgi:hypothetical protein